MTAVEITVRGPNFRGRIETWEAKSKDGQWLYVRDEEVGTPWLIVDAATHTTISMAGSLKRARLYTATLNGASAGAQSRGWNA